ncbi:MAG: sorbosone dehydrogenase [Planctomycetes bacterium]|nr:sorbosone dehydrogenase [Planctomycetota bacterium]
MKALLAACGLALLLFVQPIFAIDGVPDPDPMKEMAELQIADGFEISLFASDPMIVNPTQMNWDEKGRLWVACASLYPMIAPGETPDDKIVVLEDTDHDGKADKSTVFTSNLLVPTAVIPGDGGAYVANSTEMLHLVDTDGDGRADTQRVVLSGFGTEDTHHIIHTFRWLPDGRLYFNQSIYIHSHVETPWGPRRLGAGGIWRFEPHSLKLDVYARGFINPWGHFVDRWGQSFATDGANGEGVNYVFPGEAFPTAKDVTRIMHGLNPGQPKQCGLEILSGRHLPDDWQGNLLTNDFRGHRVNRFVLSDSGSGYISRQAPDLIRTNHVAFRPVDIKMGPDGAIYIADWYNPIINHGEVDFRDPRRDHTHGRIWRITAKGRPLVTPPQIDGATVEQLLEMLKLPETWTRDQARRMLKERGAQTVLPALGSWSKTLTDDHDRLEALWVYQSLDTPNEELLTSLLKSNDPHARAAAVRVLGDWVEQINDGPALLATAVADDHPRVRLEAVTALRRLDSTQGVSLALAAMDKPMDPNIDYALWLTVREGKDHWLPDLIAGKLNFEGKADRMVFAVSATEDPAALGPVVAMYTAGKIAEADRGRVLDLIAAKGGPHDLRILFDQAMAKPDGRVTLLGALDAAARRGAKPEGDLKSIVTLLSDGDDATASAAATLAGRWKVESARDTLVKHAADAATSASVQAASIESLGLLGGAAGKTTLTDLAGGEHPAAVKIRAATALSMIDLNHAARVAADVLGQVDASADTSPMIAAFLAQKQGPGALTAALKDKHIAPPVATAVVRQVSSTGRDMKGLIAALNEAGSLGPMPASLTPGQLAQMIKDVQAHGDPARGEEVFRMAAIACTTCHAIAGAGGHVGPDLVSLGASAPVDYIIQSILEPSAKIKEGYHLVVINTRDGKVYSGTIVQQNDQQVVLRDATDHVNTIAASDIAQQSIVPTSLMPPGLTASLRRDQFVDLVRFLSELGKEGAYKVSATPMVRQWRMLESSVPLESKLREFSIELAAGDDPLLSWKPITSHVSGVLSLDELPLIHRFGAEQYKIARFDMKVTAAGKVGLKFTPATGIEMFVDGRRTAVAPLTAVDLAAGVHTVTLVIDHNTNASHLQVEFADVPGSSGHAENILAN